MGSGAFCGLEQAERGVQASASWAEGGRWATREWARGRKGRVGCWGAWAGLTLGFLGRVLGFSWAGGFGLLGSFPFYF